MGDKKFSLIRNSLLNILQLFKSDIPGVLVYCRSCHVSFYKINKVLLAVCSDVVLLTPMKLRCLFLFLTKEPCVLATSVESFVSYKTSGEIKLLFSRKNCICFWFKGFNMLLGSNAIILGRPSDDSVWNKSLLPSQLFHFN